MASTLFIGLMSGTSTDGVDAVLADFKDPARPVQMAAVSLPMPPALRNEFLALNSPGYDELRRAALAAAELTRLYAQASLTLLAQADVGPDKICAIGAHGQTVRHDPAAGYTLQLNSPALLAELTGIDVIADFRSRDVAAGGQGAPLVPAFHHAIFGSTHNRAVLNLGGIANITVLAPSKEIRGFDTGPANVLLDTWCHDNTGRPYDHDGVWAASGQCNQALLNHLISSEPWLAQPPPKSTGRHLFNREWLSQRLNAFDPGSKLLPQDIQATLQALTVSTVASALQQYASDTQELLVCGGGALNSGLMRGLQLGLNYPVKTTSELGMPVQLVEALAFAWLAWAYVHRIPAGLPEVTGTHSARVLGCCYPA